MRLVCRFVSWAIFLFSLSLQIHAQTSTTSGAAALEDMGLKPYGAYHGGEIDTVSLSNGNLFAKIPLFSVPQRGALPLSYSLYYNVHHAKSYKTLCTKFEQDTEDNCNTTFVWQGSLVGHVSSSSGFQLKNEVGFGGALGPTETYNFQICTGALTSSEYAAGTGHCTPASTDYHYMIFGDSTGATHLGAEVARGS